MVTNLPLRWCALLLVVLIFICYLPLHSNGFIVDFDDADYVVENVQVRSGLSWPGLKWAFTAFFSANWHPLTWLSHMLDVQLFGMHAPMHHLSSLLLHMCNALLLLGWLWRTTSRPLESFAVALLFGLHPLHVESVAWVSERKDVLCALFFFLALHAWSRFGTQSRPPLRSGWYWASVVAMALGLMAKPMLVTLPAVLLVVDRWPLARLSRANLRSRLLEKVPFVVLSILSSLVTFIAQKSWGAVAALSEVGLLDRAATVVRAYALYAAKVMVPQPLAAFYPMPLTIDWAVVGVAAVVLGGISFVAWRRYRTEPWFLGGWLWFLGMLVPVIGIVQVGQQSMADRYMYLPALGLYVIVVWTLSTVVRCCARLRWGIVAAVAGWMVWLGLLCAHQVPLWKDGFTLFGHALKVTRGNFLAHTIYGVGLVERGRYEEAIGHFRQALEAKPDEVRAAINIGIALDRLGRVDEARHYYHQALTLQPDSWRGYNNLGLSFASSGLLDSALYYYQRAVGISAGAWQVHLNAGLTLLRIGRHDDAQQAFFTARSLAPACEQCYYFEARALLGRGARDQALGVLNALVRWNPHSEWVAKGQRLVQDHEQGGAPGDGALGFDSQLGLHKSSP